MDCTWLAAIQRLRRQPVNRAPGTIWRYDQAEVASLPLTRSSMRSCFLHLIFGLRSGTGVSATSSSVFSSNPGHLIEWDEKKFSLEIHIVLDVQPKSGNDSTSLRLSMLRR